MRRLRLTYTAAVLGLATLGVVATGGISQAQDAGVKLFKRITAKDEIVVGITDAEMKSFGAAPDLENLAQHLAAAGQITVLPLHGETRQRRQPRAGTIQPSPDFQSRYAAHRAIQPCAAKSHAAGQRGQALI
jgi:hypothetical protein